MRVLALAAVAALTFGSVASAALPNCSATSQRCGESCIPKTSVCHKPTPPVGATGECNDHTYTMATNHQGACSGHKGVLKWY